MKDLTSFNCIVPGSYYCSFYANGIMNIPFLVHSVSKSDALEDALCIRVSLVGESDKLHLFLKREHLNWVKLIDDESVLTAYTLGMPIELP